MTYTYKVGNNGPIAEVEDDVKITREEFKKGWSGMFGGQDEWTLFYERPGTSGHVKIKKGTHAATGFKKFTW